ncbi:helix-turn-helix transcriptional regulator [Rhodococcus sp. BP-349]|uniref:winged helix-turn-helix transcriptional regulator n=1 Tax=unclassified Rhodococcus (in: high G+C Gram-positive bacteria) TaxID=192944 RepID=UPI001C9AA622|nr:MULTISPECIES: helix-turn-helix domain-containing protein [unclassified Rhodococcus (in: high G+C Gram-positive bacteria)]MBY6537441.1 helix-turn-helix transcriptional regulator [Rhodococcus sp. BP-363]MBY6541778.1 helix-turn-helix transcriptional regulator [Rhodococcus sp. BP-369]MBY6561008.1 helix-turn-helix transcriptional regulator [Rhodococcus sp. BP-370]MBY6575300.1 helix-turn-helix transcriptional regulator [Rhodococcus sp. BP-364]MBY6584601.1 helix-turn-helix transcriptional regulato
MTPVPDADPTLEADVFSRHCTSRDTMQDITSRWGVLALAALHEGPYRFGALRRRVDGVSERMLSQTLQRLERDGLITRTVLEHVPPKVEYALTDLGRVMATRLVDLIELVESSSPTVTAARAEYDARGTDGI